jgi:hypothetical protein
LSPLALQPRAAIQRLSLAAGLLCEISKVEPSNQHTNALIYIARRRLQLLSFPHPSVTYCDSVHPPRNDDRFTTFPLWSGERGVCFAAD